MGLSFLVPKEVRTIKVIARRGQQMFNTPPDSSPIPLVIVVVLKGIDMESAALRRRPSFTGRLPVDHCVTSSTERSTSSRRYLK